MLKSFIKDLTIKERIIICLAIAINIFIIVNSCLPGGESTKESNWLVEPIKNIINLIKPDTINDSNISWFSGFIRKLIGHFSLFAVSGFLTTWSIKICVFKKEKQFFKAFYLSFFFGLALACLTELIQTFIPGRSGEIKDVRIDFIGYLLALLITLLVIFLIYRKKKGKIAG